MRKIFVVVIIVIFSTSVNALEWKGNLDITRIRLDNSFAYFATNVQPPKTCNHYGEYILFDYKTEAGKAFYSTLLSAKAAALKVSVWYQPSTTPDTDHNNGCDAGSAATLAGIEIE